MVNAAHRVALLARAGTARDQLRRALTDSGVNLVIEGDPGELDPSQVTALSPTVVLVGLEPAVERALENYDALFDSPDIEVMFDDAEVTKDLDGWDLNRWARHLVGKLVGSDLLPPNPSAPEAMVHLELSPEPGAPMSPADEMADARLEDYTLDTAELAGIVPSDAAYEPGMALEGSPEAFADTASDEVSEAEAFFAATDSLVGDAEVAVEEAPPEVETEAAAGEGAVAIFSGMGGPDAVRQLLSALPDQFPAPVLLYQHLEVGKYDRLVEQLAKVSKLPVVLAHAGTAPERGHVNVIPAGVTVGNANGVLNFEAGSLDSLIPALSSGSVLVFLSGADASFVPAAEALRASGGRALAQDPELCFDPTAALALQQAGAPVYPAIGLARQIAELWSL
jgi:chemosensory pili system protein ChpB (putative protein-glutamate methylesterase)